MARYPDNADDLIADTLAKANELENQSQAVMRRLQRLQEMKLATSEEEWISRKGVGLWRPS